MNAMRDRLSRLCFTQSQDKIPKVYWRFGLSLHIVGQNTHCPIQVTLEAAIVGKDALARLRCFPDMERVPIEGCRDVRLGEADWHDIVAGW